MPLLTGAITALALSGSPGLPVWRDTSSASTPRPYTETFTQHGPSGTPQRVYGSFASRTATSTQSIEASDTASLSATEEPFDRNEIATSDIARLSASDVAQVFRRIDASDTAGLAVGETISLIISGVTLKTASDTASLSASDTSVLGVTIGVSDTASLAADDAATVAVSAENKPVSDTANLTADDSHLLEIFAGIVEKVSLDQALLTVSDTALVREVRRIRKISLELRGPRITLEII